MLYLIVAYLPVIMIAIILPCMLIASVYVRLSDRRKARKKTAEFAAWMDVVDNTVGISELLKGKQ